MEVPGEATSMMASSRETPRKEFTRSGMRWPQALSPAVWASSLVTQSTEAMIEHVSVKSVMLTESNHNKKSHTFPLFLFS